MSLTENLRAFRAADKVANNLESAATHVTSDIAEGDKADWMAGRVTVKAENFPSKTLEVAYVYYVSPDILFQSPVYFGAYDAG